MNCRKAIRQLPAYLDHELTPAETRTLEAHLRVCVFCSTELFALRATSNMLDEWRELPARRPYADSVISQIKAEQCGIRETGPTTKYLSARKWVAAVLRAAAVLLVAGAFLFSGRVPEEKIESTPKIGLAKPPAGLILLHDDVSIKPSEWGLALRGIEGRGPIIRAASADFPRRGTPDSDLIPVRDGIPMIDHIYFPGEGMPVESIIPVSASGR